MMNATVEWLVKSNIEIMVKDGNHKGAIEYINDLHNINRIEDYEAEHLTRYADRMLKEEY